MRATEPLPMSISACGTLLHLGPELTAGLSDFYHDTPAEETNLNRRHTDSGW
jgi:hypothetical protein